MLEKLGVQCDVADHGGKALQLLAQNQYDLVFMDCQMPEMDGFTATQKIRSELNLLHLPIVALTANALSGDREACLQAGMNDYMTKPIRLEDLTLMLQKFGLEQAA